MLPGCAYKHACIELFLLLFVLLFIKGRDFCMCLFFLAKKKNQLLVLSVLASRWLLATLGSFYAVHLSSKQCKQGLIQALAAV